MNDKKIEYLIEGIRKDNIAYFMEDTGMKMTDTLSIFHNSAAFAKLSDPNTGLYRAISAYVYEILKTTRRFGRITLE